MSIDIEKNIEFLFRNMEDEIKERNRKRAEIWALKSFRDRSMNEMEGQLGGGFFRCHRGYLVNMAYVAEYDSGSITLNNGGYAYLAKEKYGEFVKAYMRYLRNGVGADG